MYPLTFSLFYSIRLKNTDPHESKFVSEYKVRLLMKNERDEKTDETTDEKNVYPLAFSLFY